MAYFDYFGNLIAGQAGVSNTVSATAAGQTVTATGSFAQVVDAAGGDTLIGGSASTDFIVADPNTVVVQGAHTGVSTVTTWMNYTLTAGVNDLYENEFESTAVGNSGANLIVAGAAHDTLNGGGGNDVLVDNGVGGTRFQFSQTPGDVAVYGFQASGANHDFIDLGAYGFTNFSQVAPLLSQDGADTLLTLSPTASVLIRDTTVSSLTASDFLLALDTSKMTLSFDDEFNSLSLYNASTGQGTWTTNYAFGTQSGYGSIASHTLTPNSELEAYVDPSYAGSAGGTTPLGLNPFSVSNGVLTITASKTPAGDLGALDGYQYTSGLLTTANSFAQTYGYFEIKAELPTGQGVWPAFWLLPETQTGVNELDVMEAVNGGNTAFQTAHSGTSSSSALSQWASAVSGMSSGFHTYGLLWTAESITWYIDGKAVTSIATPASMNQPMYMLVDLAIGGNWAGAPTANFTSAQMEVDYVRAYSLNGTETSSSSAVAPVGSTTYTATSATDTPASTAVDTISSAYSYTLPSTFVHTLTLTGSGNLTATGNNLGDHITGNTGSDTLIAGLGASTLDASLGKNDVLNAAASGVDTLIGGAGNDTFIVGNASDVVTALAGHQNVLETTVNFTAPTNIQTVTVINGASVTLHANNAGDTMTGSWNADTFYGGAGNDSFVAGTGVDTFVAGTGVDTFWVNNAADVIQGVATGSKDVVQTVVNYHLPDNVSELILGGSGNLTGWSNSTGATLEAGSGNDVLYGGAGNDSFVSGTGVDTLVGGAGSDTYFVQNAADVITPGTGTSTVWADVNYHLPDNIQVGGLTGSANLSLWAGAGAVRLYANTGNDVLYAGTGVDTLVGGAGTDSFVFGLGSGKDTIQNLLTGSHDTIDISTFLNAGYTATVVNAGANAVIDISNGETITLLGVQAGSLTHTPTGYSH